MLRSLVIEHASATSLTFLEALDSVEQVMCMCRYLAEQKEDGQADTERLILWDPTELLQPENIVVFPVPHEGVGIKPTRFTVKCNLLKLRGVRPTRESRYIDLIGELISDCLYGHPIAEVKLRLGEGTPMAVRPLFLDAASAPWYSWTVYQLRSILRRFGSPNVTDVHSNVAACDLAWNTLSELHAEWRDLVASAWASEHEGCTIQQLLGKDAEIAELKEKLKAKDLALVEKDAELRAKAAEIASLKQKVESEAIPGNPSTELQQRDSFTHSLFPLHLSV